MLLRFCLSFLESGRADGRFEKVWSTFYRQEIANKDGQSEIHTKVESIRSS